MSCLLTSGGRADSDKLVGDASSKCKEAGGAQDRIIHNGDNDEDRGSCRGISANGDTGLGRKSLESQTSATGGGGGLENEIVKEECVERVITHAR